MARGRSRVKGAASFRRLLKRLPDSANKKLLELMQRAGPVILGRMRARLPERTHALDTALAYKVMKSLKLRVGLLTPLNRSRYFYGHILDVGRKARTVNVTRKKGVAPYAMRVPAMQGRFVERGAYRDFRQDFLPDYRKLMDNILSDAAKGIGDD